jgi:prolyl oligopeptidase
LVIVSLRQQLAYPPTRRDGIVEHLHGHEIADPYRWLEDPDSPQTVAWVAAQNAVTESYLAGLPARGWFAETMRAVLRRPRTGVPFVRSGHYVVTRNDGQQDQDVWYVADSLAELVDGGRVLIDPNAFNSDGTDSVGFLTISPDGSLACFGHSEGGSDWQTFVLLDLATGEQVVDAAVIQTKFSEATWLPDSRSFLYIDFPHEGHADGTQAGALGGARLRLHRLGQPQDDDAVILEFPDDDQLIMWPELSHDRRCVVVSIVEGTENRNRLWVYPVLDQAGPSRLGEPVRLIETPIAEFGFVRMVGSRLLLRTDFEAPRGRLVSCDLALYERTGVAEFIEIVAEGAETIETAVAIGETVVTASLRDAAPVLRRFALDGTPLGELAVPGGAVTALNGDVDEPEGFVGMSSVTSPTEVFRIDPVTGTVQPLPELVRGDEGSFEPPPVTISRRRATSKDGTEVPYFLIVPTGVELDGVSRRQPRPTLLWGYGGFKIPIAADYRPGWSGWLAAGGVLAIANLRGGGEFGTDWYEQGRLSAKQNVFDDFIGVAEHLIASGATTPGQLAIHGRSNGGLLVGAAMTQRPDLFAAAVPGVGVLDLLRFQLFTIGAAWKSDYGDPADESQFADALAYSPLHNVRPGTEYPATLVLTGDHDDRVVPLHSHKFTATLQHAQGGDAPVLTRIETAAGHGMGKSSAMVAAEWADLLAFCADHTGLRTP